MSPSLISLPPELLHQIFAYILLSAFPFPSTSGYSFPPSPTIKETLNRPLFTPSEKNLYLPSPLPKTLMYASSGLLLTSWAIREETLRAICLLRRKVGLRYKLDMVMPDGRHTVVNWLALPAPLSACAGKWESGEGAELGLESAGDSEGRRVGLQFVEENEGLSLEVHFRITAEAGGGDLMWWGCTGPMHAIENLRDLFKGWCVNGLGLPGQPGGEEGGKNVLLDDMTVLFVPWDEEALVAEQEYFATYDWKQRDELGRDENEIRQMRHYWSLCTEFERMAKSAVLAGHVKRVKAGIQGKNVDKEWEVHAVEKKTEAARYPVVEEG